MKKSYSFYVLLASIVLGMLAGMVWPATMVKIAWVGDIFINMLKLICLPLVFCALVSAIASMDSLQKLGEIGKVTLLYVLGSVSIAVLIGLVVIIM